MTRASRLPLAALVAVLAVAVPTRAEEPCTSLGKGVSLDTATPAATILAEPDAWAGKEVVVEGTVKDVCEKMGCWAELVADGADPLRVKVKDGEIVFPVSARGARARAQGTVEVQEMTRDEYVGWRKHLAEEQKQAFDEAAIGAGPFRRVQVKGTGAVVCRP